MCAVQYIGRRIKGFAATVLLSFEWLWPSTACHWLRSLPFASRDPPVIIVVSEAQLDDGGGLSSLPSVRIGGRVYLGLTVCSIRWHWAVAGSWKLVAGSLPSLLWLAFFSGLSSTPNSTDDSFRPIQHLHLLAPISNSESLEFAQSISVKCGCGWVVLLRISRLTKLYTRLSQLSLSGDITDD